MDELRPPRPRGVYLLGVSPVVTRSWRRRAAPAPGGLTMRRVVAGSVLLLCAAVAYCQDPGGALRPAFPEVPARRGPPTSAGSPEGRAPGRDRVSADRPRR